MAPRYGLTATSAQRHMVNCLQIRRQSPKGEPKAEASVPAPRFDSSDPASLISTTARLVDEALALLEHAKKAEDRRTALAALREARESLAILMRVNGMLAGDGTAIDQRTQTIQIFAKTTDDDLRAIIAAGRVALSEQPEPSRNGSSDGVA